MRQKMSLAEEMLDDLREIFTRVPWWVPVIIASVAGLAIHAFTPKALHAVRDLFAWIAILLILLVGVIAQVQKLDRRKLVKRNRDLDQIRQLSWRRFEELVAEAYRRRGFAATITGGGGADGGVDVVLTRGGEKVLVQCKHWKSFKVAVSKVRELLGVVVAMGADRGILVTSGEFTPSANQFARGNPIDLIDGDGLVRLLSETNGGVDSVDVIQSISPPPQITLPSPSCPLCNSQMVKRMAKRGQGAGLQFWGCSTFPNCRGTRPISAENVAREVTS